MPVLLWLRFHSLCAVFLLATAALSSRADSVVVFNEIMYHPATNQTAFEWVELHNQMAVDVDLSGWSIAGGIGYTFAEGTVIPGGGYLVVAISPTELMAATGLTNVLGPFTGRLGNAGDKLELRNNNNRLMDSVSYGVEGDWPVGPDGSGVSLAKRAEDSASALAENWTVSALVSGTPGRRNFALKSFEITNTAPLLINGTWKFNASGSNLGTAWRQSGFDDSAWSSGQSLFQAGNATPPLGDLQPVPTVFSSGVDANGTVLPPGSPDPHYQLTLSAQSTPPPPPIPATVIQNHPAWFANDAVSSWIGPVNPGTANVPPGSYNYHTTFTFDGYNLATAVLTMDLGADNRLTDVLLNGVSQGIAYAGFAVLSGDFTLTKGIVPGANTLDFLTANDGTSANPAGFRVKLTGTARRQFTVNTTLPGGPTTYYFRTKFPLTSAPQLAALKLDTIAADGAVFYLNGAEVLRLNMPPGPIGASTFAVSNVPSPAYLGPFVLPNTALVTGTNVLAVELHQAAGGSNDVLFGADLSLTTTNWLIPPPVTLAFNEYSSAADTNFWIEIINYGSTNLDLGGGVLSRLSGGTNLEYVFPPQPLVPGALVQVTAATLGFGASPGDRLFLYSPGQASVLDAVVAQREPRARWPDGTGRWLHPTALTPASSNQFVFRDEVVINEIMYQAPGFPAVPATYGTNLLITITNVWKYSSQGQDLGTAWSGAAYNDSAWPSGQALFYNTASVLPAPKNTLLPLAAGGVPIITWYFRTQFVFDGDTNGAQLSLHPIVDDGAVFYLNGVEVYRMNLPDGPISYTNRANRGVATATFTGPYVVPAGYLVVGTNLFAVEVHQFSTNLAGWDVAFGTELYTVAQQTLPQPYRDSPEAWVELFNRSSNAVDLTGWSLAGDIAYGFAPGTAIPAGGYLVVAADVGYMQTNYPGLAVVGPYANKLSHNSGDVLLQDPAGNPANEVRYFDSKPWPAYAGGGGSSLELRDPWADNSKPEAWAASIESGRSSWSNYSYRAVSANLLGPTLWNEFQMGLLDAGECLIDDLSVVESPSGTPVPMLQNGTFETGLTAWRALGTHSHSRVEVDPDNPANHVLHLITTGWTYDLHDHLETTYAGGRVVTDGREYQVSFRAKWLAGNNRLNTRLYFNRVANTTVFPMSAHHGTPGARNSTFATNIGPTFAAFAHSPVIPQPGDAVTVSVCASDPQGVSAVTLGWTTNFISWQSSVMSPSAGPAFSGYTNYTATLGGFPAGTLVQFFVQASDGLGAVSAYPARGTNSRALFKVDEGKPLMTRLHRFRLLMPPADADQLHAHTNVMTYDLTGLTVVHDEQEVFYDVGVHLQSSERGRDDTSRVGFSVKMNADHLYRGGQRNVTLDRSGGYSGLGGRHDEILLWHAASHAGGGLLGLDCDLAQVFAPRAQEDSTVLVRLAAFDGMYFDNQFQKGGNGNLYKLEIIYYPLTSVNNDPQQPKLPQPDDVINMDIQDWGNAQDNYRWVFVQENHADVDDYSQVIAFSKAFSLASPALDAQTSQLMDLDEWMRTLAFKDLTGDADTFTHGYNHNVKTYFRPEDGKALLLLWDEDFSFVQALNTPFPGSSSANMYKITTLPNNYRRYYNHLLDLITTSVNAAHLGPWAARYAGLLGQDWSGAVNYLQQRADFARSTMPLTTPFAITVNGGNNFATINDHVTLTGTAPLSVKQIEVNSVSYPIVWTSLTAWTLTVPLPAYTNFLVAQGVANSGARPTNATDSIVVTNLGTPALRPVVVNEWMADNAGPGGFADPVDGHFQDWFELYNPNTVPVNLSGYFLSDNLSLTTKWPIPTNTVIGAHGFLLVWADNETNQNGLGLSGDLHADFHLSKTGDAIGLFAPDGTRQHAAVFGPQFQNVSQGLFPDGDTNAYYFMSNWTPRTRNVLGAPPPPQIIGIVMQSGGPLTFTFSAIVGRTYRVEYKNDLTAASWLPLISAVTATGPLLIITDNLGSVTQRFYRVVLLP